MDGHQRIRRLEVGSRRVDENIGGARRRSAGDTETGEYDTPRQLQPVLLSTLVRRLIGSLVLIWFVLTLTFVLVRAAPGDPASLLIPSSASAADAMRLRAELGLDQPLAVPYTRWGFAPLSG